MATPEERGFYRWWGRCSAPDDKRSRIESLRHSIASVSNLTPKETRGGRSTGLWPCGFVRVGPTGPSFSILTQVYAREFSRPDGIARQGRFFAVRPGKQQYPPGLSSQSPRKPLARSH